MKQYQFYREYYYDEDLWFINPLPKNSILNIELAGTSFPDPLYHIKRGAEWDFYVIEYVRRGIGYIVCGKQKYTVHAGDTYIIKRMTDHEYWSDPNQPMDKVWINVSGDLVRHLTEVFYLRDDVIVSHTDLNESFAQIKNLLLKNGKTEELAQIILQMFFKISESVSIKTDIQLSIADKIRLYIDNHPQLNLTTDDVAKHFGITTIYATRVFKASYQMTVGQYIRLSVISAAAQMLRLSDLTVGEVSDNFGFCNDNYFAYQFKRFFGVSPKQYQLESKRKGDCSLPVNFGKYE